MSMNIRKLRIERLLISLAPIKLEITDFSKEHKGHQSVDRLESHIHITIVSDAFVGKTSVQRERMIYDCLKKEWESGLHALTLTIFSAEEFQQPSSGADS